jgi:hypothetical protein
MRRHWIIYSKVIRLTEEKRAYLVSLLFPSVIPDYGTAPPYFSASLPFAASSIWLRTPHGDPFIAVYEVVAEVVQPQAFVAEIVSVTAGTNMTMTTFATNQTVGQS